MNGERFYEAIDCDDIGCGEHYPTEFVDLNGVRLGRRETAEGIWLNLYFRGNNQTEAFVFTAAAARQLRDQLTEALAESPTFTLKTFAHQIKLPQGCTCSYPLWDSSKCPVHQPGKYRCTCGPWLGTGPPPPCPVHGPAQVGTVYCANRTEPPR